MTLYEAWLNDTLSVPLSQRRIAKGIVRNVEEIVAWVVCVSYQELKQLLKLRTINIYFFIQFLFLIEINVLAHSSVFIRFSNLYFRFTKYYKNKYFIVCGQLIVCSVNIGCPQKNMYFLWLFSDKFFNFSVKIHRV